MAQKEVLKRQERTWRQLCDGSVLFHPFVGVAQPPPPAFHEVPNHHCCRPVMVAVSPRLSEMAAVYGVRWRLSHSKTRQNGEMRTVRLLSCNARALSHPSDPFLSQKAQNLHHQADSHNGTMSAGANLLQMCSNHSGGRGLSQVLT